MKRNNKANVRRQSKTRTHRNFSNEHDLIYLMDRNMLSINANKNINAIHLCFFISFYSKFLFLTFGHYCIPLWLMLMKCISIGIFKNLKKNKKLEPMVGLYAQMSVDPCNNFQFCILRSRLFHSGLQLIYVASLCLKSTPNSTNYYLMYKSMKQPTTFVWLLRRHICEICFYWVTKWAREKTNKNYHQLEPYTHNH